MGSLKDRLPLFLKNLREQRFLRIFWKETKILEESGVRVMKHQEEHVKTKTSIRHKIRVFIGVVALTLLMFIALEALVIRFSLVDFHRIIEGNSISIQLTDALSQETRNFELYMKDSSQEKEKNLEESMEKLEECINHLPYDYTEQSKEIFRLTWNIRNAYEVYVEHRNMLLRQGDGMQNYIAELYSIYDMQEYLMRYVKQLNNESVYVGNEVYFRLYPWIVGILIAISLLIFLGILGLGQFSTVLNRDVVLPMQELADASGKIAENEFFIEDIEIHSEDEVGALVGSFNRMKNAMGEYAQAMEENRVAREKIHEQELERVEMERQLEAAKMQVLVSQMNPHFLFNTLNVIAGMANLENAEITEKMTRSLSNLLRYTVHTELSVVPLKREIEMAEEYNYLQHMRFGARMRFALDCRVDKDAYEIPAFTLQPLIENAIIHGISPKIEGGKIVLKICKRGEDLVILVADNGIGMSKERLATLRDGMITENGDNIGIAYRNILQRFQAVYSDSSMEIYSKEKTGTLVKIRIPAKEAACIEY